MINKGHLKYETATLTLGNISSVAQLVPPLPLWEGVPGAASPCQLLQAPVPPPSHPSHCGACPLHSSRPKERAEEMAEATWAAWTRRSPLFPFPVY